MPVVKRRTDLLFAVVCLAILLVALALGTWQLQRLGWKQDLISRIDTQIAAPPVAFPAPDSDVAAFDYRRVTVEGRYRPDFVALLGPRSHDGDSGFHVLSVLALEDGRHLLINRGWVPASASLPEPPNGPQRLNGVLRTAFERSFWTPDYDARRNLWFWYDLDGVSKAVELPMLPAVLELAADDRETGLPIAGVTRIDLPNNHRQYAVTWFGLAGVVVVMFVIYWFRRRSPS